MSKKNSNAFYYLISISFVLFALLFSVHFWAFNESFYRKQHDSLLLYDRHIAEYIGFSDDDLAELTHFTLEYLNDYDATLDKKMVINGTMREVFTDDEKLHMIDVRRLNITANYLCIISFVIFVAGITVILITGKGSAKLCQAYKQVLLIMLLVISVLGIWIIVDFDSFWDAFHHVFFAGNDLWILDLSKDILIMIVPPDFFNNLVIYIVISFVVLIILFYVFLKIIARKAHD